MDLLPPLADFTANKTEDNCNGIIEFINLSSASAETTWLWNFGDSSTSAEQNPVHVYHGSGIYNVSLFASNSIGNHFTAKPNFIVINLPQEPVVSSASSCDTSAVLELYGAGNGTLHWYDNETGGNLLYTGDTLVTPLLYSSTVYYVEDRISPPSRFVGKEDNSGQGEYYNYNIPQYLVFDCFSSVLLKSVKVYAGSQGNRTIELHDSTGTILDSVTVNIPAGESRITLDFTLPEENNLRLVSPPMPDLFRNKEIFTNLDYPFQLYDTLSIKGNSANDLKYYYFFYDWEIIGLNDCFSSRIPVWAVINDSAIAGFSYLINNMHVSFNNSSQYFTECVWDFGDGQFSYENNPVHTYLSDGTYTVMLVAQNSCFSDTLIKTITISGINEYEKNCFNIYPIPARDKVFIELPEMFNKPIKITVYDIYGNVIYRTEYYQINSQRIEVRLSGSARGIYFVQISTLETVQYSKIIIQLY
ncbi:MAG: PKD domain-containing protein [Bacteroidia bacterium]|nr:PKD domain-containing protein [Bacteroidia bacterium]